MRNYLKKLSTSGGQSLVEVLVSLTVAAAVLSAITVGVIYSLRNSQFAKNQNLASHYAAQGMEIIRQIRDNDSTLAKTLNLSGCSGQRKYCLPQDSLTLSCALPPCGQNVGQKDIGPNPQSIYIYSREVKIEPPPSLPLPPTECGEKAYKVSVTVSWWDNVCGNTSNFCHKVNLISCLSDRKNNLLKP